MTVLWATYVYDMCLEILNFFYFLRFFFQYYVKVSIYRAIGLSIRTHKQKQGNNLRAD